jgi:hypothetical protein
MHSKKKKIENLKTCYRQNLRFALEFPEGQNNPFLKVFSSLSSKRLKFLLPVTELHQYLQNEVKYGSIRLCLTCLKTQLTAAAAGCGCKSMTP